jgi:hypothetical protein
MSEEIKGSNDTQADLDTPICKGRWSSRVGGEANPHLIDVDVAPNGNITGHHLGMNKPISGHCTDEPLNHRIQFTLTDDDGCTHAFSGIIGLVKFPATVGDFFVIIGTVRKDCPGRILASSDDDWIGTKNT